MAQTQKVPAATTPQAPTQPVGETNNIVTLLDTMQHGRAVAYPPMRGRTLWLVVCRKCPWCGSGHAHRTGVTTRLLAGRVTRVCPVWGKPYVLAPVTRGREAVRPVGVVA